MRVPTACLGLAAAAAVATAICSPTAVAIAAPAPSIAGAWQGPFLGTNFIFEFRQTDSGWTGRYQSEKFRKWADLQDISVADGVVRFSFKSEPPSKFTLKIDPSGKALDGSASFGPHAALPLTLVPVS